MSAEHDPRLAARLARDEAKELLRFVTVGSVDDGKSTLIGRLLHDASGLYEDQLAAVKRASRRAGAELDLSFFTDGLEAERAQGITIDVAYRYFSTDKRKFIIADTPGHLEYTRNMATGASTADAAVILIDAERGATEQSRRHAFIASLLGIPELVVCVNKMDLVGWREERFTRAVDELSAFTRRLRFRELRFIPVCAREGDNVVRRSERLEFYAGPTLLEHLETLPIRASAPGGELRYPVQLVLRDRDGYRGYAGQLASGVVRPGDRVMVLPSRREATVTNIDTMDGALPEARAPMSVALRLDEELDVGRGALIVPGGSAIQAAERFDATLVWMSARPLEPGRSYLLKHTTRTLRADVERVQFATDLTELTELPAETLRANDIGRVTIACRAPVFCDPYVDNRVTGAFILIDPATNDTVAAGMIEALGIVPWREGPGALHGRSADAANAPVAGAAARRDDPRRAGFVLWFTGLSGAGKSTLARLVAGALERRKFHVESLDGDEIRETLSRDLGFSREDRDENVRRIGFVAKLVARSGGVAIAAAISPYRAARDELRRDIPRFCEIYCECPLEALTARDPKGLYQRALAGELPHFTGVSDPYEPPLAPDVHLRTDLERPEASVRKLLARLEALGFIEPEGGAE
ncbi:MAG: adenylyl-sulfate kinase [Polyangiaceae bacterium]|nr:adenylyl-sulfate kinase [Polyangiaceae bacterium]